MAAREVPPLIEILAEIGETRQRQGRRHPLVGMLTLGCVATLCGYRRLNAIAEWGRNYGEQYVGELGFEAHGYPSRATWYRVFGKIDIEEVEVKLIAWCEQALSVIQAEGQKLSGLSIDGKTLRGSKRQGAENSHLLAAYIQQLGMVLAQAAVGDQTNELGAIGSFLLRLALQGRVVTTDALLTQQNVAKIIVEHGGQYVLPIKQNQEMTYQAIQRWFVQPAPYDVPNRVAEVPQKGHGRLTRWRLEATTALNDYLDWPDLKQVFSVTCTTLLPKTGELRTSVQYGITSLAPHQADAAALLTFKRKHWGIENGLHWVRDVIFDEDRSLLRVGHTHHLMATLRNLAISLIRLSGYTNIASTLRLFAAHPDLAIILVTRPLQVGE